VHLSDVAGTSARSSKPSLFFPGAWNGGRPKSRTLSTGFSMIEMLVSIAIILIGLAIALPLLFSSRQSYHLSQAATAVTGAIQATRYNAIMTGCPYSITFAATTTTYQVQTQVLTGTPPACAGAWSNVGRATPWAFSQDVSMSPTTTLQFNPNGMVVVTAGTNTFVLSNGYTTNTISVSGVGNVKVTNP
jgi:prepilin-type N-terminal cleavage/methylation domain-containing protein